MPFSSVVSRNVVAVRVLPGNENSQTRFYGTDAQIFHDIGAITQNRKLSAICKL